jgi:hypothetical protein
LALGLMFILFPLGCEMLGGIDDLSLVPCEAGLCPHDAAVADEPIEAASSGIVDAAAIADSSDGASPIPTDAGTDAGTDADAAPPVCKQTLANVGTGDFAVSFKIKTKAMLARSVLCQRSTCDFVPFFHVRMEMSGELKVDAYDRFGSSGNLTERSTTVMINDGVTHAVLIERTAGVLRITIDGTETVQTSSLTNFGDLPPLLVQDGCPCYTGAWNADITDLCIR